MTLHTLPADNGKVVDTGPVTESVEGGIAGESVPQATTSANPKREARMPTSMSTIPRLISVVEIIKREYLKTLDPVLAEAGKLSGLHQYNELGALEEDNSNETAADAEQDRLDALALALRGKRQ